MIISQALALWRGAVGRSREQPCGTAYIDAGADGIMVSSRSTDPGEMLGFCKEYRTLPDPVPLVAVPSTYASITEKELADAGVGIVIFANHLLRSAYPAMVHAAELILEHGRCLEANEVCMSIKDILTLVPEV